MQRKASKQSPARNAEQQRLIEWVGEQDCAACDREGPSEPHHILGETYAEKIELIKTNLGHWALLPLCRVCHQMVDDDLPGFHDKYGYQVFLWDYTVAELYYTATDYLIDPLITAAITSKLK